MAWHPNRYLIEGELDDRRLDPVAAWIDFYGTDDRITLELNGDFHRDIRGTKSRFRGAQDASAYGG